MLLFMPVKETCKAAELITLFIYFNDCCVSQEAEKEFLKALELNPNSAEIHGNMGKNIALDLH